MNDAIQDMAHEIRTFSSGFTRIVRKRIDLFVDIITQLPVPPNRRDCTRDLYPSSSVIASERVDAECTPLCTPLRIT